MTTRHRAGRLMGGALVLVIALAASVGAQVGKGLVEPNLATEAELQTLPHMTPDIVKALMDKRPFMSVLELNAFLLSQKLTPEQAADFYRKASVHINLNTGTREEFVLVPGAGARMAKEFAEYRPWKSWAQFDKAIGKYVPPQETARFQQYLFIPINLNTATDADLLTVPGAGPELAKAFKEHRPWKTREQFDNEIGKYAGPKDTARLWRYFVIQ